MNHPKRWPTAAIVLLTGCSASLAAHSPSFAQETASAREIVSEQPSLDAIRETTARFQDVQVALDEGYVPDPTGICMTAEMEGRSAEDGAMGIHYFRPDLLGITSVSPRIDGTGTHTDFLNPAVLLYEPQADGGMVLVGVENLVFEKAWREAGHAEPPSFHGRSWDHMVDDPATEIDESHGFAPHYDQHLYLYRENPLGALEPFNPEVTCEHAPVPGTTGEAHLHGS